MEQEVKRLQFTDLVSVLMLPSRGKYLILPNVNVAEIVQSGALEPAPNTPAWFLGFVEWRGQTVPLISFEQLNGDAEETRVGETTQVAILNGIGGREELPFFGLACDGIPRQARITEEDVTLDDEVAAGRVELNRVQLAGEPGAIPDLEIIEAQICRVLLGTL